MLKDRRGRKLEHEMRMQLLIDLEKLIGFIQRIFLHYTWGGCDCPIHYASTSYTGPNGKAYIRSRLSFVSFKA